MSVQLDQLTDRITRRFVRGCGEDRIPYTVEELEKLARWSAEVATVELRRHAPGPNGASAPTVAAPGAAEPPGAGAAPPAVPQAATRASEAVEQVQP